MSENPAQSWRRWFGLFFLAVSFGMLVWGQTLLKDRLTGAGYLLYWSGCFFFTFLAIATALLDILLVRRQTRMDRKELLKRALVYSRTESGGENEPPPQRG